MLVKRGQVPRFGRGNLVSAAAALRVRDGKGLARALREHAKNRQKAAKERG